MALIVRAFPLRRSVSDLQAFAADLNGAKAADATQFYRHYGVDHESWHVQQTPNGPWVIAVTALANPTEAASRYADATEAFHACFTRQVKPHSASLSARLCQRPHSPTRFVSLGARRARP